VTHTPYLQIVTQRHKGDCCVAAMATFLCLSYERVLMHAPMDVCTAGMSVAQLKAASKRLGKPLKSRRACDIEEDAGLLWMKSPEWSGHHHLAVLKDGLIFNTDGVVWEADVFLAANRAKIISLLTLA
jgi:hypothetical protein